MNSRMQMNWLMLNSKETFFNVLNPLLKPIGLEQRTKSKRAESTHSSNVVSRKSMTRKINLADITPSELYTLEGTYSQDEYSTLRNPPFITKRSTLTIDTTIPSSFKI